LRDQSPAIGVERARVQSSRSGDLVTRTSRFAQYSVRPITASAMVEPNQGQSSRRSSPRGVDIKSKPGQYPDMRAALVLASVLAFAVAAAAQAGPVTAPIVGEFTGGVVFYRSNGSMREAQYARLVIKQRASGMSGSVKWNLSTVPSGATPVCVHLIKSTGGRVARGWQET
jgi:hypothetical protein